MANKQIYKANFSHFLVDLPEVAIFSFSDLIPEGDYVYFLLEFVTSYLHIEDYPALSEWPDQSFPAQAMLVATLMSFADRGYCSLRDFEQLCQFSIRYLYVFNLKFPSYKTFQNFLNNAFFPHYKEIFSKFNDYILTKDDPDTSLLFIDGTKFEANANKFTFVWMKNTRRYIIQAWEKVLKLAIKVNKYSSKNGYSTRFSILCEPDPDLPIQIRRFLINIITAKQIQFVYGIGKRKHELQRLYEEADDLCNKFLKYEEYIHLADGRNSFSKVDPDATFMHMKYDYYNNTGVFKPGYNIQFGVSGQYIRAIYVSQNANDTHDFIPLLEQYKKLYGHYPQGCCADAGYGNIECYRFCDQHTIIPYIKYNTYRIEIKNSKKDRFRASNLARTIDGKPICPAGHVMELQRSYVSSSQGIKKRVETYKTPHCQTCPNLKLCTKSPSGRSVSIVPELDEYKKAIKNILLTETGAQILNSRSNQAEGSFGNIKENYAFDRFRRKGIEKVEFEIHLVAFGHNIRRLKTVVAAQMKEAAEKKNKEEAKPEIDSNDKDDAAEFVQGSLDLDFS